MEDKQQIELEKRKLLLELQLLNDIKETYAMPSGNRVLRWLLNITNILADPEDRTNNKVKLYSKLGEQRVGRTLLCKIMDTGSDPRITEVTNTLHTNRMIQIPEELEKLTKGDK